MKLYLPTVLNVLQLGNIDRREEMILFYSCQRRDCADSEVLGKSRWKKKAGAMKPARHKPSALPLHSAPHAVSL